LKAFFHDFDAVEIFGLLLGGRVLVRRGVFGAEIYGREAPRRKRNSGRSLSECRTAKKLDEQLKACYQKKA
jgi:hypothetical protein